MAIHFTKEEFSDRKSKVIHELKKQNLDGLLMFKQESMYWLTGYDSFGFVYFQCLVLTAKGDLILLTRAPDLRQAQNTSIIKEIRIWVDKDNANPADELKNILSELGLEKSNLGVEYEAYGLTGRNAIRLNYSLKNFATLHDKSELISYLRLIKSSNEINYIRKAGQISAQAQKETFSLIQEGMTENEIAKILRTRLIEHGAEKLSLLCVVSGATPSTGIVLLPTDRVIQKGETVGFDVGVSYKGYWSDLARTASVGPPSEELDEFYSWMMHLRHECNLMLQPNKTPAEVIGVCDDIINKRNLKRMGVGRIGHGVGLATTEYPSLAAFQDIQFKQGMVFACNPNFANHLGFINAEDNWVITENKPDLLSDPVATNKILTIE